MKKIALFVLLAGIAGNALFAQTTTPTTTTIRGTLGLSKGHLAVKSGTITYYVRGLERYISFIDGLKDGAQVSLDGYASVPAIESQTERWFYPVTLTLNDKVYEVGSPPADYGDPFVFGRKSNRGRHRMGRHW
jgi:hypothetical protein